MKMHRKLPMPDFTIIKDAGLIGLYWTPKTQIISVCRQVFAQDTHTGFIKRQKLRSAASCSFDQEGRYDGKGRVYYPNMPQLYQLLAGLPQADIFKLSRQLPRYRHSPIIWLDLNMVKAVIVVKIRISEIVSGVGRVYQEKIFTFHTLMLQNPQTSLFFERLLLPAMPPILQDLSRQILSIQAVLSLCSSRRI